MVEDAIRLHVFDVGHGASALLQVCRNDGSWWNMLVDGGPKQDLCSRLAPIIGDDGTLDVVALTHIHTDHSSGFERLFDEWKGDIVQFWYPYPLRVLTQIATGAHVGGHQELPSRKDLCDDDPLKPAVDEARQRIEGAVQESARDCDGSKAEGDWSWPKLEQTTSDNVAEPEESIRRELSNATSVPWDTSQEARAHRQAALDRARRLASEWYATSNSDTASLYQDLCDWLFFCGKFFAHLNTAYPTLVCRSIPLDQHQLPRFHAGMTIPSKLQNDYAFRTAMASYATLNRVIANARRRSTAVALVQAVEGLALSPSKPRVEVLATSPAYPLVREMERRLKTQQGAAFEYYLQQACELEAANVAGLSLHVRLPNLDTSLFFPGDNSLQGSDHAGFSSDVLLCPHHGGHCGNFVERFEKALGGDQRERLVLISKGSCGERPSPEWRSICKGYRERVRVLCTNASKDVSECEGCNPSNWKESRAIIAKYGNAQWTVEPNDARCRIQR